jgi:hypothetical protein
MFTHRPLPWFACTLLVLGSASEPATALPGSDALSTIVTRSVSPVVMVTGRKGTRSYEPDDIGTTALAKDVASSSAGTPEARQQRIEECMASWDNKTHITKDDWRNICVRELSDE